MYHTIMVPLDGSAFGEQALPLALTIARRAHTKVHLVHVCAPQMSEHFLHMGHTEADELSLQTHYQHYLDQLAGSLAPRWEVQITTTILHGPVAETLEAHALESGTDLVVMTTHGRGALERLALGSIADTLARSLPLPLLLVRPHEQVLDLLESVHEAAAQRILIPLDGSPLAEAAIEPAIALGMLFDAEYTLLQSINPPMLGYAITAHAPQVDQQALDVWREEANRYLGLVAERLRQRHLRVKTDLVSGHPPAAILEYAGQHAFELIALATHGRGGVARLLLGSTTDGIVHESCVPVLVCRSQAALVVQPDSTSQDVLGT